MINTREVVSGRILRQEGIAAGMSSVGYPGAFETWRLVRSSTKEPLGFLSFHSASATTNIAVIKFSRFLPESAGALGRCYTLQISRKGAGVRSLLCRALTSQADPYLDPKIAAPAPEIYRDESEA